MPLYEYICRDCQTGFEALITTGNRDEGSACPQCGGEKVARKVSLMASHIVKSGRSGGSSEPFDCGASSCCGGSCGLE